MGSGCCGFGEVVGRLLTAWLVGGFDLQVMVVLQRLGFVVKQGCFGIVLRGLWLADLGCWLECGGCLVDSLSEEEKGRGLSLKRCRRWF